MKDCPCGENCPVCNDKDLNSPKECKDFCPDKITDMDKCLEVWGVEEAQCMEACDAPRKQCIEGCDSGPCKDQCDDTWIEAEICCHRQCPCHAKCAGGCPCAGDDCGLINIDAIQQVVAAKWAIDVINNQSLPHELQIGKLPRSS